MNEREREKERQRNRKEETAEVKEEDLITTLAQK